MPIKAPRLEIAAGRKRAASQDNAWTEDGLCAETDPELFYSEYPEHMAQAKRICARCSVQTACLNYALEAGEEHGIWGGLDTHERNMRMSGLKAVA